MKITYGTDVGVVRDENQDSVFVHAFSDDTALMIVADGMGGYEGGSLASSLAIEHISARIIAEYRTDMSQEELHELLRMSIKDANVKIYSVAKENQQLSSMGTTVVVSILSKNVVYTANVGDSREYVFDGNKLNQITTDHSLVNDLLKRGLISAEEADVHPQRNVITRAVGTDVQVETDTYVTKMNTGDIVLICSDGLYTMVNNDEIEKILTNDGENPAQELIELANKKGGRDNISVICAKILDEVK